MREATAKLQVQKLSTEIGPNMPSTKEKKTNIITGTEIGYMACTALARERQKRCYRECRHRSKFLKHTLLVLKSFASEI